MALRAYIILLLFMLLSGCKREQMDDCFTSTGPERVEQRSVEAFHGIDLEDRIDLILDHMPGTTITVEAGKNLMDQISTEVRNGVLHIRNKNKCNWVRSFKPRITVRVPIEEVQKITLRGSGDISATDTIRQDVFRLEQWGAMGTARFNVDVREVYIGLHTGAGDVVVGGNAGEAAFLYSDMYGTIDVLQLRAPTVNINNSGLGDFHCWPLNAIYVQIYNAGDVYYRGEPSVFPHITGSGRLIKVD